MDADIQPHWPRLARLLSTSPVTEDPRLQRRGREYGGGSNRA